MDEITLLNRNRELEILTKLSTCYPNKLSSDDVVGALSDPLSDGQHEFIAEAHYLFEHGLVDLKVHEIYGSLDDVNLEIDELSITAKGMDFLQNDGGLSAILGVVTVKLHDDTIKQLLIRKVTDADGDKSIKEQMISSIKALPAEATKSLAMKLINNGIAAAPAKLVDLQQYFSNIF